MIVKEEVFERTRRGLNGRELLAQGKVVAKNGDFHDKLSQEKLETSRS